MLISHLSIFSSECLFRSFPHFYLSCVFLLLLSFQSSLYILVISAFVRSVFYKDLLPICGLSFHLLNSLFFKAKGFNFNKDQLINHFFYELCFWCCISNITKFKIFSYIIF